jgi:pyruvate dehydrogenase E2 component (dihydrolipoamide acetyltransferase)
MTHADSLRTYCVASLGWDRAPTYSAILVRSCALAFKKLEWANRSYKDGGLIVRDPINIGVAVATPDGLMVPVIANADQLNLRDSANALRAAAQRAQEGRLKPSDMVEKSMTISNLGMYSVDQFIAIIDTPDPMILAVGRVADRVAAVDGRVAIQPMCTLTLSVDHRAFDGVQGAQFLEQIKDNLESPFAIIG